MGERVYESDLSDEEWDCIKPLVVKAKRRGPKSRVDLRQVLNGIFYLLRTGCQWRYIPKEYGNFGMIYGYFQRWTKNNLWQKINDILRTQIRKKMGRRSSPSCESMAAIIDSQSVKTVQKGGAGAMMPAKKSRAENGISP